MTLQSAKAQEYKANVLSLSEWDHLREPQDVSRHSHAWLHLMVEGMGGPDAVLEGVVVLGQANLGPYQPQAQWPKVQPVSDALARAAEQALAIRASVQVPGAAFIWAVPLISDGDLYGVVAVRFNLPAMPARAMAWMRWGQGWLLANAMRGHQAQSSLQEDLMFLVDTIMLAMSGDDLRMTVQAVLIEVAHRLNAERISVGLAENSGNAKLWSISHAGDFSGRLSLTRGLESAMDESLDQASAVDYSQQTGLLADGQMLITRAHKDYLQMSGSGVVLSIPHAVDAKLSMVFVFEWADEATIHNQRHLAAGLVPVMAKVFAERRLADVSWLRRLVNDTRDALSWLVGPRHAWFKVLGLVVIAALVAMSLLRMPLEVSADARLEGAVVRQIHAPFDGFVSQSLLRAGQEVLKGGVLALLDDRDLKLEVERWSSEQAQFRNQYQDAQAQKNLAQVQINLAQGRQAQAQKSLSESNLSRSRVNSPMAGIIVSGDLSQQLGAPVQKGQLLFEVAPLNDYRVVLQVNERDIDLLELGQEGRLMLTALAGKEIPLKITQITPVTEVFEGSNRFRVEASVEPGEVTMRPGMKGIARLDTGEARIVWVWLRGLVEWSRLTLWKWWGL
jgi:RND family efflux transporter MFP subunit